MHCYAYLCCLNHGENVCKVLNHIENDKAGKGAVVDLGMRNVGDRPGRHLARGGLETTPKEPSPLLFERVAWRLWGQHNHHLPRVPVKLAPVLEGCNNFFDKVNLIGHKYICMYVLLSAFQYGWLMIDALWKTLSSFFVPRCYIYKTSWTNAVKRKNEECENFIMKLPSY